MEPIKRISLWAMLLAALFLLQTTTGTPAAFQNRRLRESSGVAISRSYPGVLWTHNDSGDGPYLYATDFSGADRGWLLVPGASAIDWEDMALGPCPPMLAVRPASRDARAASCIYIGDTGDNRETRPWVTLYAIREPAPPETSGDTLRTTAAPAVLRLKYPDGAHDIEAMYVSPRDTAVYLVSKGRNGSVRVYRSAPTEWNRPDIVTASLLQQLDIIPNEEAGRVVTAAAIRSDGRRVAVRTYSEIYLFYTGVGGRLTPAPAPACNIEGVDRAGEAIAFLDDSTFVLTSEAAGRHPGTIVTVKCPF